MQYSMKKGMFKFDDNCYLLWHSYVCVNEHYIYTSTVWIIMCVHLSPQTSATYHVLVWKFVAILLWFWTDVESDRNTRLIGGRFSD